MEDCKYMKTCMLRSCLSATSPGLSHAYELRYCRAKHAECARFMVAEVVGLEHVPTSLQPYEKDDAIFFLVKVRNEAGLGVNKSLSAP